MERIIVTSQVRLKRRLKTSPSELRNIANILEKAGELAVRNEVVELDVVLGSSIIAIEWEPDPKPAYRLFDKPLCEETQVGLTREGVNSNVSITGTNHQSSGIPQS